MMQIAEHHPEQLYERNKGAAEMTHKQLHEFASGSEKGKPTYAHARKARKSGEKEPTYAGVRKGRK